MQKTTKPPAAAKISKRPHLRYHLPIINSVRKILLGVTENMCKMGKRDSPEACALALAARANLRGLRRVQVMKKVAYFEFPTHIEKFFLSKKTRVMVKDFDSTGTFLPGFYEFNPIPESETRRRAHGRKSGTGKRQAGRGHYMKPRGNLRIGEIYATK